MIVVKRSNHICLYVLLNFTVLISTTLANEIDVWIMAGEAVDHKNISPSVIETFHKNYPNVSIDIGRESNYTYKILLANEDVLKKIKRFEEQFQNNLDLNPQKLPISVRVNFIGWHDDPLKKIVETSQKNGVDIVQVGSTWVAYLAHLDIINNISDVVRPIEREYINPVVQNGRVGKEQEYFAIPWSIDIRSWFYNRVIVRDYKIAMHELENLESLSKLCAKFNERRAVTDTSDRKKWFLGLPTSMDDYSTLHIAMAWIWGWGGRVISNNEKTDLLEDKVIDSLTNYLQLFTSGCAPLAKENKQGLRLTDIEKRFLNDEIALISIGPWFVELALDANKYENFGSIPGIDGASPNAFTGGSFLVLVNSPRPAIEDKAARALLKYLSVNADQSIGLPPQKAKLEKMLSDSQYNKFPLILLRRESRLFPVIPEWGKIEDILLKHISNLFQSINTESIDTRQQLENIVRGEMAQANQKIEAILRPNQHLPVSTIFILLSFSLVAYYFYQKNKPVYIGKEELIRRFRRIKEILHTAKIWKSYVNECNIDTVRQKLLTKLDNVLLEASYFKSSKNSELTDLRSLLMEKIVCIKQYRQEVSRTELTCSDFENRVIEYFESHIRPLINEMSNALERYCVKIDCLEDMLIELETEFEFSYELENIIGGMLIRPNDLRICLENILENARIAVQGQTDPQIKLSVKGNPQSVEISILDNGKALLVQDIATLMENGQGLRDTSNILSSWEGSMYFGGCETFRQKPAFVLNIKRI